MVALLKPKTFRDEPSVNEKYLQHSQHLDDYIISMRNGDLLALFKVDGRTHDCASDRELITWNDDLNTLIKSFGTDHVEVWSHEYHHQSKEYPDSEFTQFFPRYLDEYNRRLQTGSNQMVNDLYLTVLYRQIGDKTQKFLAKFERPSADELAQMQAEAFTGMEEVCEQIMEGMKGYGIKRLGIYYRDKNGEEIALTDAEEKQSLLEVDEADIFDEPVMLYVADTIPPTAHAYSKALEFLYFLVNLEWSIVPVCRDRIGTYIMENRVVSSVWGDIVQVRALDRNFYTTAIEIRDYDKNTEPGQFNLLKEADFEYLLTQTFSCISEASAKTLLERQEKSMMETGDRSQSQLEQLNTALDMLLSKEIVMGYHHATIHVFDTDQRAVQRKARKAKVMLSQCGFVGGGVGLASEAAYFAKVPGNQKWAPRPTPINSWNFFHFSPYHNFMRGKPDNNPWGPAVTMFRTANGTPLYFNFHVTPLEERSIGKRPLGHMLLTGTSGEGKTTLLDFLLCQCMKFNPRMFCYDRDRGMEPFIRSVGGYYKVLQQGVKTNFSPLKQEGTPRNIATTKNIMRVCAEITNNGPLDKDMGMELNKAVDAVMGEHSLVPPEARDITRLNGYINHPYLKDLIKDWTNEGQYGWLFDNGEDALDLDAHDIFGFDLTEFIAAEGEIPSPARTPLLMYLLYRIRNSIDGKRRVIQCFDEFHAYLDDPVLKLEIKRGIKTDRKKDAIYLFSTQEPNDALASSIGKTVMSQTPSKICLRDPDASRKDYSFLTDAEFDVLLKIPEHSRQFLVKQGSQSALATFNLKIHNSDTPERDEMEMDNIISILSGEPQNAELAEELIGKYGPEPGNWIEEYWRLCRH